MPDLSLPRSRGRAGEGVLAERDGAGEPTGPSHDGGWFRRREVPETHVCEMCGTVMYDHNCKIVCPTCGYKRDCSDP